MAPCPSRAALALAISALAVWVVELGALQVGSAPWEGEEGIAAPWESEEGVSCPPMRPELQLREKLQVALWQSHKDADVELLREGVLDHPMLTLTANPLEADFVLWSVFGDSFRDGSPPENVEREKILMIDWSDGAMVVPYVSPEKYQAVFKRSFVYKKDGVLTGVSANCPRDSCFPFSFGVLNQYFQGLKLSTVGERSNRSTSLVCSLRPWLMPSQKRGLVLQVGSARNRVLWWLHRDPELPEDAKISEDVQGRGGLTTEGQHSGITMFRTKFSAGHDLIDASSQQFAQQVHAMLAADSSAASTIGPNYKDVLRKSFLAVTANPASYEGDHRLWEHFASGNVVLSDAMWTAVPFAPVAGEHYVEFNVADVPGNQEAFWRKVHELLEDTERAKQIACRGLQHVMQHHRSVSRVDYIMRTMMEQKLGARYTETGLQLRERDALPTREQLEYTNTAAGGDPPPYFFSVLE